MKLVLSSKRPCHLKPGEVRRVPQDPTHRLIGYHICCHRCGFGTAALSGHDGLEIEEHDEPGDITLSTALRCTFCRVLMHVSHGELRLEEDANVRHVRLR